MEKGDKAKKNKGKGKAKLKIEGDNTLLSEYGDYVYDEFDDFMQRLFTYSYILVA